MTFKPPSFDESAGPWDLSRMEFTLYAMDLVDIPAVERSLVDIEDIVPGAMAWAIPAGWKPPYRKRLRKLLENPAQLSSLPPIGKYLIQVPIHGGWLVEDELLALGVRYHGVAVDPLDPLPSDGPGLRRQLAEGSRLVEAAHERGLLTEQARCALPFQLRGAAIIATRPAAMEIMPAGSGKTLVILLGLAARAAAGRPAGALVVCPGRARPGWAVQTERYTTRVPFRLLPAGMKDEEEFEDLASYLDDCREHSREPLVIVGAESVADHLDDLDAWAKGRIASASGIAHAPPSVLVMDEIHEIAGDPKRWSAVAKSDGTIDFTLKSTARSGQVKRTVAAMLLSRFRCFDSRVTLTATAFGEGKPRRMYGPCDVTWPGGLGLGYRAFAERYAAAVQGEYGMKDTGATHLDELRARASFFLHEVPWSESHAGMPALRTEVLWLSREDLDGPDAALDREMTRAAKAAASGFTASDDLLELQRAAAAARKHRWVLSEVMDGLRGRQDAKVVVFANRHQHVEKWAADIEKRIASEREKDSTFPPVRVEWGHGEHPSSPDARARMAQEFADSTDSCVFVASGQAFGASINGFEHADLAILAALPSEADDLVQWRGRFDRHGGRPTLLKVPLARGTYDEVVVTALTANLASVEAFFASDETRGLREKLLRRDDPAKMRREVLRALGLGVLADAETSSGGTGADTHGNGTGIDAEAAGGTEVPPEVAAAAIDAGEPVRATRWRCPHFEGPWTDSTDDSGRAIWRGQTPPACPRSPTGCPEAVEVQDDRR